MLNHAFKNHPVIIPIPDALAMEDRAAIAAYSFRAACASQVAADRAIAQQKLTVIVNAASMSTLTARKTAPSARVTVDRAAIHGQGTCVVQVGAVAARAADSVPIESARTTALLTAQTTPVGECGLPCSLFASSDTCTDSVVADFRTSGALNMR